jgi:dipeptidyl aminopeptidase/acylaminoacyl peptidase
VIDPEGRVQPRNLTSSANPVNEIVFSPVLGPDQFITEDQKTIILTGFNRQTKQQGFYQLDLTGGIKVIKLFEEAALFGGSSQAYVSVCNSSSSNGRFQILRKETDKKYPNLFLTQDFRNYVQLTDLKPEASINWISKELHNWKLDDGTNMQGILYKPENFDVSKKYPVIIEVYDQFSDQLFQYPFPCHSAGAVDKLYLVSKGYLVLTPDIHFETGKTGECFLNGVLAASKHLSKLEYVDTTKLGLQGHSFGGFGVNYIITHTNRFAAALSASANSNLTSSYTWNRGTIGQSNMGAIEIGQYGLGASFWEKPELYIENSPVFNADKITTPVLIIHNKLDPKVPYFQGLGFYLALRRLQRKCWMLEYEGEAHVVTKLENQLDYENRAVQFFDHFLKGENAVEWLNDTK